MTLKDSIRLKICAVGRRPIAFSLKEFTRWAAMMDRQLLLQLLNDIQVDLDEEERNLREVGELVSGTLLHHVLRQQWCLNCTQLRAYYRRREEVGVIRYNGSHQRRDDTENKES